MNSETFCIVPWAHVRFEPNGMITPCCKINKHASDFNVNTIDNFDQYWNSDYLKKLRQDLGSGQRPDQCKVCWQDEDAGKPSRRQESNKLLAKNTDIKKIAKSQDWTSDALPISLDLNLGNICNFKCVMCFPLLSSRIQAERKANANKFTPIELMNINFDGSWPEKSLFQSFLESASPNIRVLETKGGEPFLVKNLTKTIQSVKNKENAIFAFNTNGSVDMPLEFYNEISKFEKVWGSVSIDGIGTEGEYVRYGSEWATVEKNIHKLSQLKNCTFRLTVVLQFFSPLTFPAIFEFAKKHNYVIELLNCTRPDYLSINSVLPEHMEEFQNWARNTAQENPSIGYLNSLNGFLNQYKFDAELHQSCRRYLDAIDSIRNNQLGSIQRLFLNPS